MLLPVVASGLSPRLAGLTAPLASSRTFPRRAGRTTYGEQF
ncbi:MAG: hypothetical protein JWQ95_4982 [Sphaerisporangium sp.]|jgi:hypothetical protein|nr:hypothetical protein [Sphaerisporangium sp.]